jgi:hypothetical protein
MSEPTEMELVVDAGGDVRCIYGEELNLRELGKLQITRASHVEPDAEGYWWADMGPVDGPVMGPFRSRSEALQAERGWLATSSRILGGRFPLVSPTLPLSAPYVCRQ